MKETVKNIIADLIYSADWEINPTPKNGFNEHYMINEDDVIREIIKIVKELIK